MSWFNRHLNWTWVLVYIFGPGLTYLGLLLLFFLVEITNIVDGSLVSFIGLPIFILPAVLIIWMTFWLIRSKDQSLWNLLWLIIPFGFFPLLTLKNRA